MRAAGLEWNGWYAFRRGAATLATKLESPLAAKGLLRHSNIATTQQHYIKEVPDETARVTTKVDALLRLSRCGSQSSRRLHTEYAKIMQNTQARLLATSWEDWGERWDSTERTDP